MSKRSKKIRLIIGVLAIAWAVELIYIAQPSSQSQLSVYLLYLLIVVVSASVLFTIGEAIACEGVFIISRIFAKIASIITTLCFIASFPLFELLEIL